MTIIIWDFRFFFLFYLELLDSVLPPCVLFPLLVTLGNAANPVRDPRLDPVYSQCKQSHVLM